jgi:protein-disulfide isomerase
VRRAALLSLALPALLAYSPALADADDTPVVAVFDPQLRRIALGPGVAMSLADVLAASLVASGKYQVAPRDQLRQKLGEQKKRSYRLCHSQVCQIELGKELAAQKSLASRVMRIGKKCIVTATLYDLKKAVAERAATAEGGCDEDALLASVKGAAAKLLGVRATGLQAEAGAPASAPASPPGSVSVGPADAKVRIEDFTDYQCPFCAKSRQAIAEAVKNLGARGGKVRYLHRDYPLDSACNPKVHSPFHPMACQAAYAARCAAEQGKFELLDALLFQEGAALDDARLRAAIVKAGLDEQKLDRCAQSPRTRQAILDDIMLGVVRGVVGTPTLYVNGEKVSGARTVDFWEQKLRALLR